MMDVDGQNQYADIDAPWRNEDKLYELYVEKGLGSPAIADRLGCSTTTAWEWIKKAGIDTRKFNAERTPWFGTDANGYERWSHNHQGKDHQVYHHRLLAVSEYGFENVKGKQIHHKNGIMWDNRPDNIDLVGASEHQKLHIEERNKRKPYTNEHKLKEAYKNRSRKELAEYFDCTEVVIKYWINKHEIRKSELKNGNGGTDER